MKQVLVHSYYYPPIGGAGAQRPLKMTRYLGSYGYATVVVTGKGPTVDRWAPEDDTLESEVPEDVEIARVQSSEPSQSAGWVGRAERWLGLPSPWARWWVDESVALGTRVGGEADLVYVWMQPYVSAQAGVRLARRLGKPWVADLGDPWALDEMMVYPTALHRRLERRKMGELMSSASAIVMSTPEAVRRLLEAFPHLSDRPVVHIPNGFDAADFDAAVTPRSDAAFRIVHTGYLHTELGRRQRQGQLLRRALGGSIKGVDILTRSHVYLLEAVDRLLSQDPTLERVVELHLAGVLTADDQALAGRSPVVRVHGYVTHRESIELMRTANLLFLPMQNLPPSARATIVPGKTYEYLASQTPIMAAVPDGDARDILAEAGSALLCRPDDVDGLVRSLAQEIERFQAGRPPVAPRPDVLARFEYRHLARELANVFGAVLGKPSDRALAAAERGPDA